MNVPSDAERRQRGQVTVLFLLLVIPLVLLGGLAYDGAQLLGARREASNLALEAARAGAQAVETAGLYRSSGRVRLDSAAARRAVSRYLPAGVTWTAHVHGDTVTVTVRQTQPLQILSMIGIPAQQVSSTATARAVKGVVTGGDV